MSAWDHLRPVLTLLALLVLLGGLAYPGLMTEVAKEVSPGTANGSLLRNGNGTAIGSSLLGQNITCAYQKLSTCPYKGLFWVRPSMADYVPFTTNGTGGPGSESPYGPTDPRLLNQTLYFMSLYGTYTVDVGLYTDSESGLDPDVTPEAALVQVPRVAHFTNLSQNAMETLVDEYEVIPMFGYVGPSFVNIMILDIALLNLQHPGGT